MKRTIAIEIQTDGKYCHNDCRFNKYHNCGLFGWHNWTEEKKLRRKECLESIVITQTFEPEKEK